MKLLPDFISKPTYSEAYLELHKVFDVPLHGLTSEQVRFQQYAFRNEINLFRRTCDLTGERIISQYPENTPFPVYHHEAWRGDSFVVAHQEYDPKLSFFQQFHTLQKQVPRMSVACDTSLDHCPYVNCVNRCKDCHMIFASGSNEDCFYAINLERSKTVIDASIAHSCTFCYEITSCRDCYNVDFSVYAENCSDSRFLYDCRACKHCFLCVGLENQSYCFMNKQYTKEEYESQITKYKFLDHRLREECYGQLEILRQKYPHRYAHITNGENCSGNDISHSQNCLDNYITEYSQDCYHGSSLRHCKNCLDFNLRGDPGEMCYLSMSCGYQVYHLRMCVDCRNNCSYLMYCDSCPGCSHCFGCVGLKNQSYCILNKQYSKEEYELKVQEIVHNMKNTPYYSPSTKSSGGHSQMINLEGRERVVSERGQFFPPYCSSHALNNSMTYEYFEVDEALARSLGYEWMDKSSELTYDPALVYTGSLNTRELSFEHIQGKILICEKSQLPFKIEAREFEILQKKKLSLPKLHWKERLSFRDKHFIFPWTLKKRMIGDTGEEVLSCVPEKYSVRFSF